MVAGVGNPSLGLNNVAGFLQSLGFEQPSENARDNRRIGINTGSQGDLISLSQESLAELSTSVNQLQQQNLDFAFERLNTIETLLDAASELLGQVGIGQDDALAAIQDIAEELRGLGDQVEQIFAASSTQISIQLVEGSLSQSFNASAQSGDSSVSVAQQLDVEFSFLQISISQQSVAAVQTDEGLVLQQTSEQTQLVVAQLSVESEQTLAVENAGPDLSAFLQSGDRVNELLSSFRGAINRFQSLTRDFINAFKQDEIQPEIPVDLLQQFLGSTLEISRPSRGDQV